MESAYIMGIFPILLLVVLWIVFIKSIQTEEQLSEKEVPVPQKTDKKDESFRLFQNKRDKILAICMVCGLVLFFAVKQGRYYYQFHKFIEVVKEIELNNFSDQPQKILKLASDIEVFGDKHKRKKKIYNLATRLYTPLSQRGNGAASYAQFRLLRDRLNANINEYRPYLETSAEQGYASGQYMLGNEYYQQAKIQKEQAEELCQKTPSLAELRKCLKREAKNIAKAKKESLVLLKKSYQWIKKAEKQNDPLAKSLLQDNSYLQDIASLQLAPTDKKKSQVAMVVARNEKIKAIEETTQALKNEMVRIGEYVGRYGATYRNCRFPYPPTISLGEKYYLRSFSWIEESENMTWKTYRWEDGNLMEVSVIGVFFVIGSLFDSDGNYILGLNYALKTGYMSCASSSNFYSWRKVCRSLDGDNRYSDSGLTYILPSEASYPVPTLGTCRL